jgi:hypothetical protein
MSKRIGSIVAILIIATGANPDPPPKPAAFVDPTAKARLDIAQKAMNSLYRQLKEGKGTSTTAPLLQAWVARYGESLIAAATTKDELIKAFEFQVVTAKNRETALKSLQKRGEMSELDVLDATYLVLRAEADLARVKAE